MNDMRSASFGEHETPSVVDRLGRWLSTSKMRKFLGREVHHRAADIGCGFDGALGRHLFARSQSLLLVDIHVDPALQADNVEILEGVLPDVLDDVGDDRFDAVICNNVLEHLSEPLATARHLYRITAPGGMCLVNVPSWRGKFFLELAAFRLRLAPADEMNDHKTYYDPRDLWPLLVSAGFRPSDIRVRKHKGGLNTIAACRKDSARR
jgi:SAM-dependent methyltransferase